MGMVFPYQEVATQHPIVSLGGRQGRPRPLLFQFFSALFLGEKEELHLSVNALYPGT